MISMTLNNDKWEYMKVRDNDHLYDEEGNRRRITTDDFVMPYGKYKGLALSEISDRGYLEWAQGKNREKGPTYEDWYFDKIVTMRIKELS